MTKQHRRKRQQASNKQKHLSTLPFLPFTVDEALFLKEVLVSFVYEIETSGYPLPNVACAMETAARLQEKLAYMLDHNEEKLLLSPNEVIVLDASLELYAINTQMLPGSLQKQQVLRTCPQLKEKLSPALSMAVDALQLH